MSSAVHLRFGVLAAVAALLPTPSAWADAIVYRNGSYIVGVAHVLENGIPTPGSVGHFFDPTGAIGGPPPPPESLPPTSGTWTMSDSVTHSELGATATAAASVGGTLTPTQFTGSARTTNTAAADGVAPGISAQSWGLAGFSVAFELDEPHTFAYSARYFAEGESQFGVMLAGLEVDSLERPQVFSDTFDPFTILDESRSHTGILGPGRYLLGVRSHPWYVTTPEFTRKLTGFDFTFDLAPAAPVPEPATILLVTAGLAGIVRRAHGRTHRAAAGAAMASASDSSS